MSVTKQLFPVPLSGGLDTKSDPFQLPATSLIEAYQHGWFGV